MIKKTFDELYESYYSRYTVGCFCIGDAVSFQKGIEKSPEFKKLPKAIKNKLKDMIGASNSNEAIICVQDVNIEPFMHDVAAPASLTLAYSLGGGRYINAITIPGSLAEFIEKIDNGLNQVLTIPPNNIIDHRTEESKPVAIDEKDIKKAIKNGVVKSTIL